ncbi:hypothetical protein ACJIZ3_001399 [Penstemon smallii]|uniref:Uncharacterized protein n=1 Tax=Penstemon smallii TaxID=265156 RepID=A0ABD3U3I5_9LAMI
MPFSFLLVSKGLIHLLVQFQNPNRDSISSGNPLFDAFKHKYPNHILTSLRLEYASGNYSSDKTKERTNLIVPGACLIVALLLT